MQVYRAELHVHTVHSACAEVEMIPPLIIEKALEMGVSLMAITDHNASANVVAVMQAAEGYPLTILPGMELQTQEEVHCLCLFDTLEQVYAWQAVVDSHLPDIKNRPDFFGEQYVVDSTGGYVRTEDRMLAMSVNMAIDVACRQVHDMGGLFIPAHVNRPNNGLLAILGFVPENLPITALEISRHITPDSARRQFPQIQGYPLLQNGDVHMLDSMLGMNEFFIESPTIQEIQLALAGKDGRWHRLLTQQPIA